MGGGQGSLVIRECFQLVGKGRVRNLFLGAPPMAKFLGSGSKDGIGSGSLSCSPVKNSWFV